MPDFIFGLIWVIFFFKSPNNFSEFLEMVIPLTMGLLIVQNYAEVKRICDFSGNNGCYPHIHGSFVQAS